MADPKIPEKDTSRIPTDKIAQEIENMMQLATNQRKTFARHWYDNDFFDEGHHFRFISRTTGRIVDLSERATLYSPKRAIPKASRQIRGMANLILSQDFKPLVLPEKTTQVNYPQPEEYQQALEEAKNVAKRSGHWLEEEWKNQDMDIQLALMVLLTMKNCISYMQIWPDPVEEAIKTQVYDAFDIYLVSNLTSIYDSPFIGKVVPKTIKEIKANENFDSEQLDKITPDNRYASDEIKEAYLSSKFGRGGMASDAAATLLQKEFFIKEYLSDDNIARVRKSNPDILKNKEKGDLVIRQVFSAGSIWLRDEYVDLPDYPFVDFRLEPGKIYQPAQMERFISANKSLDSVMSRLERYIHTMNVGVWMKHKGESFKINNVAGGLMAEYEGVPPQQMALSPIPSHVFNFIDLLVGFIEEQGVTTSALGKIPKGVKAWGAIESLKASEFANLHIPIKMLKKTIQKISEKMLDIADKHFVTPQTIMRLEKGEPDYFDVIGQYGVDTRKKIKEEVKSAIPLKKDYKVEIEIESGLGYTDEGKKGRMMEIAQFVLQMAQAGYLSQAAAKVVVERLVEIYKFGPTAELMEAMDTAGQEQQLTDQQIAQIKVALLETTKDLQKHESDQRKMDFLEVLNDLKKAGMGKGKPQGQSSREVERSETVETGKEGKKTKREIKETVKEGG